MWFNYEVKMPRATTNQVNNSCINIDGEEWRDVAGYENIYQVSSAGRVRHLSTTIIEVSSSGEVISSRKTKEYILKQCSNNESYLHVGLVKNGKVNSVGLHRVVAEAFVPKHDGQTEVHHIDRNRRNNSIDNLIWVTPEEHRLYHKTRPDYGKRAQAEDSH